jgi:carbon-monoxide dehydrogenase large subunit
MATIEETPAGSGIGASPLRKEDAPLIAGQGRFVDDLKLPGMLYAAFVRSPHASANILSIDTSAAESLPGVVRVLTAETLGIEAGVPCASNPFGAAKHVKRPMLAEGRVRMLSEPVALVIASDRSTASDAVDRVVVDYEPTPVVIHAEDALEPGAPLLHDDAPGNLGCTLAHKTEGFDAVFDAAPVKIRQTIDNQRLTPVAIETRAVLADWSPAADELTLYSSTQIPHYLRTFVALICGIPEGRCRVIAPDVGGGFGSKLNCYAEEFAVAQASKLVGVPVKWIEGRSEAMLATTHGRDQLQHVELAADRDGRVQALRIELIQNYGAYLQFITPSIAHLTVFMVPGAYDIQQVDITCRGAFTNTTPTDAYRGAGRPEATHMIERMMDLLADELGIDPAEIRRRNFIQEFPYTTATGLSYDSGNYAGALDKALAMADYAGFEGRRAEARARGMHRGIGLSTWVEICGLAPSAVTHAIGIGSGGWESSILRLHPTGTATVITGSSAHGQGHATTWSQIVESELGIPFADIDVLHGDTQYSPYGIGTFGSRSLAVGGTALQLSCVKVREKARLLAAHMLECAPDDLEWSNGKWSVKGSPERAKTIQELAGAAWLANSLPEGMEPNLEAATFYDPPNCTFPFGTHIAEVEIDPETGKVTVERYTAIDDCGNVVNPVILAGQVHGGIAQSIAQALYEETVYDDDGQMLTGTLVDYMIPSAAELPHFDLGRTVTPSPTNPLGVKGIGEAGTIAASAAVVNAAVDAVSHLGIKHLEMPLQPARVWNAMQKGGGA